MLFEDLASIVTKTPTTLHVHMSGNYSILLSQQLSLAEKKLQFFSQEIQIFRYKRLI